MSEKYQLESQGIGIIIHNPQSRQHVHSVISLFSVSLLLIDTEPIHPRSLVVVDAQITPREEGPEEVRRAPPPSPALIQAEAFRRDSSYPLCKLFKWRAKYPMAFGLGNLKGGQSRQILGTRKIMICTSPEKCS